MNTATSNGGRVIAPVESRVVEYVPFAATAAIKLNVTIVRTLLCAKTKSGKVCDDTQAIKFIMLCQARLLNPFEGDAFLVGYDTNDGPSFSLITAHQAFLKRAEMNQEYDGMESGVIVQTKDGAVLDREGDFILDNDTVLGGWATVYFKNRSHPMKKRLKLRTFNKGHGRWRDDPAGMIVKCSEADALRSSFPTMLGGLYMHEELLPPPDTQPKEKPKTISVSELTTPPESQLPTVEPEDESQDPDGPCPRPDDVPADPPVPKGPDCTAQWAAILTFRANYHIADMDKAIVECGFGTTTPEEMDAEKLTAVLSKLREWAAAKTITMKPKSERGTG